MTDLKNTLEKITAAWEAKDEAAMREFLHDDYHFKGPMMELNGPDECIDCMKNFPFEGTNENIEMITEGNKVVQVWDWVITQPFQERIPMVEVLEFEDGKIIKGRMFFDTNLFPAAIFEQMIAMKNEAA
jgi:ketosteroid isomerase-like protein